MPAPNSHDPASRRTRVLRYFEDNPGFHRCTDVATALDEPTHGVAVAARNLMVRGEIERREGTPSRPGVKPPTVYGIKPKRKRKDATK